MERRKHKAIVIDDDRIVAAWMRLVLESGKSCKVVATFQTIADGLRYIIDGGKVDLVILDLAFRSGTGGIEGGLKLRKALPKGRILVVSRYDNYYQTCRPWADGYLVKDGDQTSFLAAVKKVLVDGQQFFGPGVQRENVSLKIVEKLTPVERKVFKHAVDGLSNPDIAIRLGLSRKTIEVHLARIYDRLELAERNRLGLASLARAAGLISPEP